MAEITRNKRDEPIEATEKLPEEATHPEPKGVSDAERPAVKTPTEAREAQTIRGGLTRRIMMISLTLVAVAFALLYLMFFGVPGE